MRNTIVFSFLLIAFTCVLPPKKTFAGNNTDAFKVTSIPTVEKNALKKYKHINTQNKYTKQMQQPANKAYQSYQQKKMQNMINTYQTDIFSSKQFVDAFKKYVPASQIKHITANFTRIGAHDKLFIFISSSMPLYEVRQYVQQVAFLNEPDIQIVMRGFVGGIKYIKPTIRFFYKSAKIDPYCHKSEMLCKVYNVSFNVDPLPFRKYHITRVPAFVFDPDFYKITKLNINNSNNAYKLYGDVSLKYAIKLLYKKSGYLRLKDFLDKYKSKEFFNTTSSQSQQK